MESGTVTTTRSSLFKPVSNYQEILNEFENCYDASALGTADKLFWLASESNDGIILVVNDCIMSHTYMDAYNIKYYQTSFGYAKCAVIFRKNK